MNSMIILLVYLFIAAVMDLKIRRIKNFYIIIGLVIALISGFDRFDTYIGILIPLFLTILFYLRLLGAGDIKLLMVTGAFLGAHSLIQTLPIIVLLSGAGAVITIFINQLIWKKQYVFGQKIPLAPAIFGGVFLFEVFGVRLI